MFSIMLEKFLKQKKSIYLVIVFLYFCLVCLVLISPNQSNASSGYTCDPEKDYGNTCIDTKGKPRCKTPYSEQCGSVCSRQVTCGRSGEFITGECVCQQSQSQIPTCPVATIWDGTICKGTAVGTDYETKDQPPRENGGNVVADNGQHGGEISRQEGNKLVASSGGSRINSQSSSESGEGDSNATLESLTEDIENCLNSTGNGAEASEGEGSVEGIDNYITCTILGISMNISLSEKTMQEIIDMINVARKIDVGLLVAAIFQLYQPCNNTDEESGELICKAGWFDGNNKYVSDQSFVQPYYCDQDSQYNQSYRRALLTYNGADVEVYCKRIWVLKTTNTINIGDNTQSPTESDDYNQGENDTNNQGSWSTSNIRSNMNNCPSLILVQEGLPCINTNQVCGELICKVGWFDNDNNFFGTDPYCNQDTHYLESFRIGTINKDGNNVIVYCKRMWVTNNYNSESGNNSVDGLKVYAQTLPPAPVVVDVDNLEPGKYLISVPGFQTAEFTIVNDQARITFFNDVNNNGVKDIDEPIINPKDFATTISKTESIYKINLNLGWNLINLPVANSMIKKASDLSDYIRLSGGDIYQISTYQSGNWIHYVSRINDENKVIEFGTDFNIIPGQSYFINSATTSQFTISGNDFLEQPPINLINGWNLVGFPAKTSQTASEILKYCRNFGKTCQNISRFVDGFYESVVDESGIIFGNDFQIQNIEGYFILNNGNEGIVRW